MLHHVSLGVADLERSAAFYDAALSALGYARVWTDKAAIGYGYSDGGDKLAITLRPDDETVFSPGFHLALAAPSREAVALFYEAALRNGGTGDGAPGSRPHYGKNYYAAFVTDPDGHRIEAVINSTPAC